MGLKLSQYLVVGPQMDVVLAYPTGTTFQAGLTCQHAPSLKNFGQEATSCQGSSKVQSLKWLTFKSDPLSVTESAPPRKSQEAANQSRFLYGSI